MIDRKLTSSLYVACLNKKLVPINHLVRCISGTTSGASVSSHLRLHRACFLGLLSYSLPLLNDTCKIKRSTRQSLHRQAICVFLGLPGPTSTKEAIAEVRLHPTVAWEEQKPFRCHLRHLEKHKTCHIARTFNTRPFSSLVKCHLRYSSRVPETYTSAAVLSLPPW